MARLLSANSTTIDHAKDYFGDVADFYQDSGDLSNKTESKITKVLDNGNVQEIRS